MVTGRPQDWQKLSAQENDRMRQASELLLQARRETQPIESLPEALRPHGRQHRLDTVKGSVQISAQ